MQARYKKYGLFFIKGCVSLVLMGVALSYFDMNKMLHYLKTFSLEIVVSAFLFCLVSLTIQAMRWYLIIKNSVTAGSMLQHMAYYWSSILFNIITPAAIGGDVYRVIVYRNKTTEGAALPLGFIVQERLINLMGYCACYLLCFALLFFSGERGSLGSFLYKITIVFAAFFILLFSLQSGLKPIVQKFFKFFPEKIRSKLNIFLNGLQYHSIRKFTYLLGITLGSLVSWVIVFFLYSV